MRYVYKNGTAFRSRVVTIKVSKNPHRQHSRFAVVISKKVLKSAVGRNRIRRRVYEVVRLELPKITAPHDVAIMIFSSEAMTMPHDELRSIIIGLFTDAGLYNPPS